MTEHNSISEGAIFEYKVIDQIVELLKKGQSPKDCNKRFPQVPIDYIEFIKGVVDAPPDTPPVPDRIKQELMKKIMLSEAKRRGLIR